MEDVAEGLRTPVQRVLVVEDDPSLGRLVQLVLGKHSTDVTVARTGETAIQALHAIKFDAIASDISLPDMSGLEVIAAARELAPASGIVAVTGFVDVDVAVRSMKAGADDFLGKPFEAEILWHVLQKAIDSRQRRLEAEQAAVYRDLAYHDALTGCPNRRYLDEFLAGAVTAATETGERVTVAYLDIDNFKLLNDFVGHEQGDAILCRLATALGETIRPPAAYGRFGGDEFLVVFPGASDAAIRDAMEGLREAVHTIEIVNGSQVPLPIRISYGTAAFRGAGTPRQLIAEAEDNMYLDKSAAPIVKGFERPAATEGIVSLATVKALRNLVKAIDRRDSYTRYHSDHATHAALRLAAHLGLPSDQVTALTIGGPIHDLGKIVVPDEILRKPGPLNAEERRAMEEHPVLGAAIAAAITDYDTVINLVRHHHERFDGDGYPGALKGTQISLPTRLFTVADAYSAMTTDRPYRRGLDLERALAEIRNGAGSQFDPDIAREFVRVMESDYSARNETAA